MIKGNRILQVKHASANFTPIRRCFKLNVGNIFKDGLIYPFVLFCQTEVILLYHWLCSYFDVILQTLNEINLGRKIRRIILPVVLFGCRIWSLTPRKEYKLPLIENRVLRKYLYLRTNSKILVSYLAGIFCAILARVCILRPCIFIILKHQEVFLAKSVMLCVTAHPLLQVPRHGNSIVSMIC
jgi:hypothetical protein